MGANLLQKELVKILMEKHPMNKIQKEINDICNKDKAILDKEGNCSLREEYLTLKKKIKNSHERI